MLCLEGRAQNITFGRLKHRKVERLRFQQANLEEDFSSFGRFDLMIHFGLLYHIRNTEQHLKTCFRMTDEIVHETVVMDSKDPQQIVFCQERADVEEEALEGVGCRPSPAWVERVAQECGFTVHRYFTADLNAGNYFFYDWKALNNGRGTGSNDFQLRRFWRFQRAVPGREEERSMRGEMVGAGAS